MIIFGSRGITTTKETGEFDCPSCISPQTYKLKRVRNFFTLYFIPVIPLNQLGEYVECGTCKDTYKPQVLELTARASQDTVEAEYYEAIKMVMAFVLLADGMIDDAEISSSINIFENITGNRLAQEDYIDYLRSMSQLGSGEFTKKLQNLQGLINDEGKELVLKAAFYVALSDGEFAESEQALVTNIGRSLGMTEAHITGIYHAIS